MFCFSKTNLQTTVGMGVPPFSGHPLKSTILIFSSFSLNTYTYIHTHTHIYININIYIYIYIYIYIFIYYVSVGSWLSVSQHIKHQTLMLHIQWCNRHSSRLGQLLTINRDMVTCLPETQLLTHLPKD